MFFAQSVIESQMLTAQLTNAERDCDLDISKLAHYHIS